MLNYIIYALTIIVCFLVALIFMDVMFEYRLGGIDPLDFVNPKKWFSYVQGMVYGYFLQPHILEQTLYRYWKCADCVKLGKCKECGCKMPEKAMVPDESDALGKWGPFISKDEWEQAKLENKLEIKFVYGSKV